MKKHWSLCVLKGQNSIDELKSDDNFSLLGTNWLNACPDLCPSVLADFAKVFFASFLTQLFKSRSTVRTFSSRSGGWRTSTRTACSTPTSLPCRCTSSTSSWTATTYQTTCPTIWCPPPRRGCTTGRATAATAAHIDMRPLGLRCCVSLFYLLLINN